MMTSTLSLACQAHGVVKCGRPAVWQHPIDQAWLCDSHAPPARHRARCVVCGKTGAVRPPNTGEWLCLEHRPG